MRSLTHLALLGLLCTAMTVHAEEPKKIAFVDTGNTGRSVSAEAIANDLIQKDKLKIAVISRAVDMDPYDVKPEENAVTLLKARGLDVSQHRAVQVTLNDIKHSDVVLTMTEKHRNKLIELFPDAKGKTFTISEYASGTYAEVPDAWGKPMAVYQEVFKALDSYVPAALKKVLLPVTAK